MKENILLARSIHTSYWFENPNTGFSFIARFPLHIAEYLF